MAPYPSCTTTPTGVLEVCPVAWQTAQLKRPLVRALCCAFCVLASGIALLILLPQPVRAGGPRDIAGISFFDSTTKGVPLPWAGGAISYYTDRGNLSPVLSESSADAFVADSFSRWASISTAAVSAVRAGQLGENVSGANVGVSGGAITLPPDILPSAVNLPVAIVYDADGVVTNALLGQGAGSASSCFDNAVYSGVDNFSADAHLLHALVVLNGMCAQTSQQLPDMEYRLVRVLGRVLGLDWSQMNVNVFTRTPVPTPADYAGLTIMHAMDHLRQPVDRGGGSDTGRAAEHHAEGSRYRGVLGDDECPHLRRWTKRTIKLIQGSNPATPVGGQAPNPVRV